GEARHTLGVAVDPFADAETRYRVLVDERRNGGIQARAFRLAVRDLAVLDGEGRRWMLGPEDGIWYRRERERWLQADPPRRLVCTSCGHHNLGRHSFCVECGQRLNRPSTSPSVGSAATSPSMARTLFRSWTSAVPMR